VFQTILKKIAEALQADGISYMVIGGQAVLLYGEPRLTKDIDVTLGVGIESLAHIKGIVESIDLKPLVEDSEAFAKETMVFPVVEETSGIRVDFIFSFSPYERQAIDRATAVNIEDVPVMFASLEDLVIQKIISGRPRDLEDIRVILIKNPDYDAGYIERWLGEFDTSLEEDFSGLFKTIVDDIQS
jgi:predicted nucleotidyltransferase